MQIYIHVHGVHRWHCGTCLLKFTTIATQARLSDSPSVERLWRGYGCVHFSGVANGVVYVTVGFAVDMSNHRQCGEAMYVYTYRVLVAMYKLICECTCV